MHGLMREGRETCSLLYPDRVIDTEHYLLTCMRYIELNPVRAANMVDHPSMYPWSSYRRNTLGDSDNLITPHIEYSRLGSTDEERQLTYCQLFRTHIPEMTLEAIREATNKAWILGSDRFKIKMENELNRPVVSSGQGGDRKSEEYRQGAKFKRNQRV